MNKNIDIEEIRNQSKLNMARIKMGLPVMCPVTGIHLKVEWTGEKFNWTNPTQKAHFISNSKAMLKKYGKDIIDHELNWCWVYGLEANNAVQIKNRPILENLNRASKEKSIWLRMPLIAEFNDACDHIDDIAALGSDMGVEKISLLPYHEGGKSKSEQIGRPYKIPEAKPPDDEHIEALKRLIEKRDIKVSIGS